VPEDLGASAVYEHLTDTLCIIDSLVAGVPLAGVPVVDPFVGRSWVVRGCFAGVLASGFGGSHGCGGGKLLESCTSIGG
jgi:hypothetical protein